MLSVTCDGRRVQLGRVDAPAPVRDKITQNKSLARGVGLGVAVVVDHIDDSHRRAPQHFAKAVSTSLSFATSPKYSPTDL